MSLQQVGSATICTDRHHIPEVKFWVRATIFWVRAPLAEARIQCHMPTRFEITWYITPGTWKTTWCLIDCVMVTLNNWLVWEETKVWIAYNNVIFFVVVFAWDYFVFMLPLPVVHLVFELSPVCINMYVPIQHLYL